MDLHIFPAADCWGKMLSLVAGSLDLIATQACSRKVVWGQASCGGNCLTSGVLWTRPIDVMGREGCTGRMYLVSVLRWFWFIVSVECREHGRGCWEIIDNLCPPHHFAAKETETQWDLEEVQEFQNLDSTEYFRDQMDKWMASYSIFLGLSFSILYAHTMHLYMCMSKGRAHVSARHLDASPNIFWP